MINIFKTHDGVYICAHVKRKVYSQEIECRKFSMQTYWEISNESKILFLYHSIMKYLNIKYMKQYMKKAYCLGHHILRYKMYKTDKSNYPQVSMY